MKGMHYSLELLNLYVCLKDFIVLILNYWAELNLCVNSVDLVIKLDLRLHELLLNNFQGSSDKQTKGFVLTMS